MLTQYWTTTCRPRYWTTSSHPTGLWTLLFCAFLSVFVVGKDVLQKKLYSPMLKLCTKFHTISWMPLSIRLLFDWQTDRGKSKTLFVEVQCTCNNLFCICVSKKSLLFKFLRTFSTFIGTFFILLTYICIMKPSYAMIQTPPPPVYWCILCTCIFRALLSSGIMIKHYIDHNQQVISKVRQESITQKLRLNCWIPSIMLLATVI